MDIAPKQVETYFATIDVAKNYMVVAIKDGGDLGQPELAKIKDIADEYIDGPMGYISNHIHDYSISPVHIMKFLMANPRLKHIAYVSEVGGHKSRLMALLRLIPSSVKFKTFKSMDAAVEWMDGCLSDVVTEYEAAG